MNLNPKHLFKKLVAGIKSISLESPHAGNPGAEDKLGALIPDKLTDHRGRPLVGLSGESLTTRGQDADRARAREEEKRKFKNSGERKRD